MTGGWSLVRIRAKVTQDAAKDPVVHACMRLVGLLSYIDSALTLYLSDGEDLPEIPEFQRLMGMGLLLSYLGELATLFNKLVNDRVLVPKSNWSVDVVAAWDFLNGADVAELRTDHMKAIRDKVVFHMDAEPVQQYLESVAEQQGEVLIWDSHPNDSRGYQRAGFDVMYYWLLKHQAQDLDKTAFCLKIVDQTMVIVGALLSEKLQIEMD